MESTLDLGDFLGYIEAERFHSNHKTVRKVLSHHGVRFSRDLAGYAAGGLTQPTGTKWVTDTGIKPWKSLIKPTKNKTYSNKVGWVKPLAVYPATSLKNLTR